MQFPMTNTHVIFFHPKRRSKSMVDMVILPKFQGVAVHWVGILQQKPE